MGHCFTRLFSRYFKNNKFETKKRKTGKTGKTIVKLSKITDNFYCLNRKGNQWSQSEKELLDTLIDYKIFYPIPSGFAEKLFLVHITRQQINMIIVQILLYSITIHITVRRGR